MLDRIKFILLFIGLLGLLTACGPTIQDQDRPSVIASTTIIGDVTHQVGGDLINLHVLLPVDSDPHSFSPTPKDVALVETASLVLLNGFNLEESLADLIRANAQGKIVTVSDGIKPMMLGDFHHSEEELTDTSDPHARTDPHVWMDPGNVQVWTANIAQELSELDPENASVYRQNAEVYLAELEALNRWVIQQVEQIPQERRVLVTDHDSLGYFAAAYGFRIIGVVVPGGSTLSDPSAQQIAALEDTIAESKTPVIFVGTTVNTQLAGRIAEDTGITLVPVYTGSLSRADGAAPTYIEMIRYNVNAIVRALK
jgi:ABC-type Zn uptake system ZnuABC Zn-binding protein ZnuA